MGLDFRDFNNDGYPDIAYVALNNQTFPVYKNSTKGISRSDQAKRHGAKVWEWPAMAQDFTISTMTDGKISSSPAATSRRTPLAKHRSI